jgi:hypothetical protein
MTDFETMPIGTKEEIKTIFPRHKPTYHDGWTIDPSFLASVSDCCQENKVELEGVEEVLLSRPVSNVIKELERKLELAREQVKISANQLEGVSLAIEEHGQNINVSFFIEEYKKMADSKRQCLKEIGE